MKVTVDEIEQKDFARENGGYSKKEVNDFLEDIMETMDSWADEIKSLQQQLAAANARAESAEANAKTAAARPAYTQPAAASSSTQAVAILEMAEKLKNETLAKAESDAKEILTRAQSEADEQLRGLKDEHTRLTDEITALKQTAADYKANFEALLQAQQECLEKATGLF